MRNLQNQLNSRPGECCVSWVVLHRRVNDFDELPHPSNYLVKFIPQYDWRLVGPFNRPSPGFALCSSVYSHLLQLNQKGSNIQIAPAIRINAFNLLHTQFFYCNFPQIFARSRLKRQFDFRKALLGITNGAAIMLF